MEALKHRLLVALVALSGCAPMRLPDRIKIDVHESGTFSRYDSCLIVRDSQGYVQNWHSTTAKRDGSRRVDESLIRNLLSHTTAKASRSGIVGLDLRCETIRAVAATFASSVSSRNLAQVTERLCDPKTALELVRNMRELGDGTWIRVDIELARGDVVSINAQSYRYTMFPWHIRWRGREIHSFDQGLTQALADLLLPVAPDSRDLNRAITQRFGTKDLFLWALLVAGVQLPRPEQPDQPPLVE
jgi:hypothetical protein